MSVYPFTRRPVCLLAIPPFYLWLSPSLFFSVYHSVVVFVCHSAVLPVSMISSFLYVCLSFRRCSRLFLHHICLPVIPSLYLSVLFRHTYLSVYHFAVVLVCLSFRCCIILLLNLSVYYSVILLRLSFQRCTCLSTLIL